MNNKEILNNISKIQESRARNYFESKERFFLINILEKLQNNLDVKLNKDEVSLLKKIFQKYLNFVN